MNTQNWLPLNEYSTKYKVSMSTLRRRIRGNAIKHKFEDGKYWLAEEVENMSVSNQVSSLDQPINLNLQAEVQSQQNDPGGRHALCGGENLLASAQKLLQEIKGAYISVLQEKEAQIMALKDELADLKTLIKTLEYENSRLNATKPTSQPALLDSWIDSNL